MYLLLLAVGIYGSIAAYNTYAAVPIPSVAAVATSVEAEAVPEAAEVQPEVEAEVEAEVEEDTGMTLVQRFQLAFSSNANTELDERFAALQEQKAHVAESSKAASELGLQAEARAEEAKQLRELYEARIAALVSCVNMAVADAAPEAEVSAK